LNVASLRGESLTTTSLPNFGFGVLGGRFAVFDGFALGEGE
jgi:hypothetical protein